MTTFDIQSVQCLLDNHMADLGSMRASCESGDKTLRVTLILMENAKQSEMIWMVFIAPEPGIYDEMARAYFEIAQNRDMDEDDALIRAVMNVLISYCVYDVM